MALKSTSQTKASRQPGQTLSKSMFGMIIVRYLPRGSNRRLACGASGVDLGQRRTQLPRGVLISCSDGLGVTRVLPCRTGIETGVYLAVCVRVCVCVSPCNFVNNRRLENRDLEHCPVVPGVLSCFLCCLSSTVNVP
jgi:hypothetical protein